MSSTERVSVTLRIVKVSALTTPALLVHRDLLERNLATMSSALPGDRLRPHVKAHKCTQLAAQQAALGHAGFTCATIAEMEGMARAGLGTDLLLANEVADATRLGALASAGARVTVAVDSEATIAAAVAARVPEVVIDVNVGLPRCGCRPEDAGALGEMARARGLTVRGVMGYEGHAVGLTDREERTALVRASMELLLAAHAQVGGELVTAGGTGSYDVNHWATEIQAGSYALMDTAYGALDLPFSQALEVLATVISVAPDWAVADCGLKALGMDHGNPSMKEGSVRFCSDEHVTFAPRRASARRRSRPRPPRARRPDRRLPRAPPRDRRGRRHRTLAGRPSWLVTARNAVVVLRSPIREADRPMEMPTVLDAAREIRAGERSSRELVEDCLLAIAHANGALNAFVHIDAEGARAAAAIVDDAVRTGRGAGLGPLAGVPFGVKDLEDCEGMPTTRGSRWFADGPPATSDSILVGRLRAAGAIPIGKTATPELGAWAYTASPLLGVTRNPWNLAAHARRVERWVQRRGRCRSRPLLHRERRGRLHPNTRVVHWPHRPPTDLRTHTNPRRHAPLTERRRRRADHDRRRHRAAARRHRRPRPEGSHLPAPASGVLPRGARFHGALDGPGRLVR